jgi:hypothetical protein
MQINLHLVYNTSLNGTEVYRSSTIHRCLRRIQYYPLLDELNNMITVCGAVLTCIGKLLED